MEKVRVGIIGLGFMGTTHLGIYRANPKAELVAVADINPAKLKGDISSVVGNIGGGDNSKPLDLHGVKTYSDPLALIRDANVDLVDICVPTFLHRELALAALNAGKNVLLEKPIARNVQEAQDIVAAAKRSGKCFSVGMCVRAWPEYRFAREYFRSGKAGKLASANFRRLSPNIDGNGWENWFMKGELSGGALLDLHLHDADQVRYFFGRPKAVTAFGAKGVRSDNAVDHVVASYDFGDGSLVVAEGGWAAAKTVPFEMSFQIVCSKATIKFDANGLKIHREDGVVESPELNVGSLPTGWHIEIDHMLDRVLAGGGPDRHAALDEHVDSLKIVEAEQRSVDTHTTATINY